MENADTHLINRLMRQRVCTCNDKNRDCEWWKLDEIVRGPFVETGFCAFYRLRPYELRPCEAKK